MAEPADNPPENPSPAPASGSGGTPLELDLGSSSVADIGRLYERMASERGTTPEQVQRSASSDAHNVAEALVTEDSKAYAPRDKAQDSTRQIITLWLIGLFCVLIVFAFVALFIIGLKSPGGFDDQFFNKLKTLLDVLLGPVITLLSSAIGFYFGYQQGAGTTGRDGSPAAAARRNAGLP